MNAQTTTDSSETFTIIFQTIERRLLFESKFTETKQQFFGKEIQTPLFLREIALPKTRSGLLFCCASPTLPFKNSNLINLQHLNQVSTSLDKQSTAVNNAISIQNLILSTTSPIHNLQTSTIGLNTNQNTAQNLNQQISSCLSASSSSSAGTNTEISQDVWICNRYISYI